MALAQSATGIRDSSGNRSSFPATAPTDGAGPVPTAIADTNGTTNGLFQPGDTLAVTFSEPLAPASVPTASTVTLADPVGAGNDTLNVTGLTNGARATGSNGYLTLNGGVASWASTLGLSNGDRTVTRHARADLRRHRVRHPRQSGRHTELRLRPGDLSHRPGDERRHGDTDAGHPPLLRIRKPFCDQPFALWSAWLVTERRERRKPS